MSATHDRAALPQRHAAGAETPVFAALSVLVAVVVGLSGCGREQASGAAIAIAAAAIGDAACAACGMVVGEQPSPRGQVVYRDGSHSHACSLSDLAHVAVAPSPLGNPVATFVEVQDAAVDPVAPDTAPQPWHPADSVFFVAGVARRGVMGPPLLAFAAEATARAAATRLGGEVRSWADVIKDR